MTCGRALVCQAVHRVGNFEIFGALLDSPIEKLLELSGSLIRCLSFEICHALALRNAEERLYRASREDGRLTPAITLRR